MLTLCTCHTDELSQLKMDGLNYLVLKSHRSPQYQLPFGEPALINSYLRQEQADIFFELPFLQEEALHNALAPYDLKYLKGIVCPIITTIADLEKLHLILSTIEIEWGLPVNHFKLILEFGAKAQIPNLIPNNSPATGRILAIKWNPQSLQDLLGAQEQLENTKWLPPYEILRNKCLLMAKSLQIIAIDACPLEKTDIGYQKYIQSSRQLGFDAISLQTYSCKSIN